MGCLKSNGIASFSLSILQICFCLQYQSEFVLAWYPYLKEGPFSGPKTLSEGKCEERCEKNRAGGYDQFRLHCSTKYVSEEEKMLCLNDCINECSSICVNNEAINCPENTIKITKAAKRKEVAGKNHEREVRKLMASIEIYQARILILAVTLFILIFSGMAGVLGIYLCCRKKNPPIRQRYNGPVSTMKLKGNTNLGTETNTASVAQSNVSHGQNQPLAQVPPPQSLKGKNQSTSQKSGGEKLDLKTKGDQKKKFATDFVVSQGTSESSARTTTYETSASSSGMSFYHK